MNDLDTLVLTAIERATVALEVANRMGDALAGMVGFVQLMASRYPDFPVDNHRVLEAMSALKQWQELQ